MSAPALPLPRRRRLPLVTLALGVCALAAVAALVIARPAAHTRAAAPPNPDALLHGVPLQRARCADWLAAPAAQKDRAVTALTAIVGAPTEYQGVRGSTLSRADSWTLLNNACGNPIARNFLLYELYIRAAAFRPLVPSGS